MSNCTITEFKNKNVHFIGIGGISMSALAEILATGGYKVSGSDIAGSKLIDKLKSLGVTINIGHDAAHIEDADLVIYTAAIKDDNPELKDAKRRGLPLMQRAELLGQIMSTYGMSIGVSGSHGKTTTTSMLSVAMLEAGLDPTVLLGGELNALGGNVRIGNSQFFLTEACEYVESFLNFKPFIAVILNIDSDHLDYFKDIDQIYNSFVKFARLVPQNGYVIGCVDDPLVKKLLGGLTCNTISYGINSECDFKADAITLDERGCASFNVLAFGSSLGKFHLKVPGKHNVYNALATIAVSYCCGIPNDSLQRLINAFSGTQRRFEYKGSFNGVTVIDDYAHHPTEITATLSALKSIPHKKTFCVFQPHTYTRTIKLFDDFVSSFAGVDEVIITDIYSAREKDPGEVHPLDLSQAITAKGTKSIYLSSFNEIGTYIKEHARSGDIVMTIGAGDVHIVGEMLIM